MPGDNKKKADSGKGSPDDKKPMKLHATAKEFVPSAVSCSCFASNISANHTHLKWKYSIYSNRIVSYPCAFHPSVNIVGHS